MTQSNVPHPQVISAATPKKRCGTALSRPRAAEVMVDGTRTQLVRKRETLEQLYAGETLLSA